MFNSIRKISTVLLLGLSTVAPPSLFAAADAVRVTVALPEIVSPSYHGFCIPGAGNTSYSASSTDAVNLSYESLSPYDGKLLKNNPDLLVIETDPFQNKCNSVLPGFIRAVGPDFYLPNPGTPSTTTLQIDVKDGRSNIEVCAMVVEGIDGGWPTSLPNDGWTVYYNSGLELQGSSDFTKLITYCKVFDVVSAGGSASALGDPHFQTFNGQFFSYHGACDLVLMRSMEHGVTVHIRTTRVDRPRMSYSYISNAAVQVGRNVMEVSEDGSILVNGKITLLSDDDNVVDFAGQYSITRTKMGSKKNIVSYKLNLDNGRAVTVRSNTKSGMLFVDIDGHFADSEGLLGPPRGPGTAKLYSRDGSMDLVGNWNSFGEEWQTRSDEPMLFQKVRAPQHPVGCSYEAAEGGEKGDRPSSLLRGRRLIVDDVVGVSEEIAKKACANAVPGKKMEFCIADIMVTNDLDLAEDPYYGARSDTY